MKGFPFVLGTDIVHLPRFDPLQNPSRFVRLAQRILHPNELASARSRKLPSTGDNTHENLHDWLTNPKSIGRIIDSQTLEQQRNLSDKARAAARWLAGRWAAKEAAKKAWGASFIGWKDARVDVKPKDQSSDSGSGAVRIVCQLYEEQAHHLSTEASDQDLWQEGLLSISHDGEYAIATVIAEPLRQHLLTSFETRAKHTVSKSKEQPQAQTNET